MQRAWVAIGSVAHAVRSRESHDGHTLRRGAFIISYIETYCGRKLTTEVFGDLLLLALDRTKCHDCWEAANAD
jgi:hypothetical protein